MRGRCWPGSGPRMARRCPIGRARSGLTLAAESSVHFPAAGCCPGVSVGGGRGMGGCAMARAAVRESATFAGRADQVREARAFVGRLLGASHPCADVAVLLASDSLNNQHELEGSDVAAGQGNRANTQGRVGLGWCLQAAARRRQVSRSVPDVRFLRHCGRGHCQMRYVDRDIPVRVVTHCRGRSVLRPAATFVVQ